ncbi:MAG: DUF4233 domain-containing protein [Candidatus Nanopelagicales bacterium]
MRALTASVLIAEAIVVWLAIPVAILAQGHGPGVAWGFAALGLACALLPGAARRPWYLSVGWALQLMLLASAVLVPMMGLLGAIFAGLWWAAIHYGNKAAQAQG